jgi:hypothetical protein
VIKKTKVEGSLLITQTNYLDAPLLEPGTAAKPTASLKRKDSNWSSLSDSDSEAGKKSKKEDSPVAKV